MLYREYMSAIFYRSYIPLFAKTISKKGYIGIIFPHNLGWTAVAKHMFRPVEL